MTLAFAFLDARATDRMVFELSIGYHWVGFFSRSLESLDVAASFSVS